MEITKAPNQISEIIQQRKTFLGTKTAKNKDSHFSVQYFAPSPCSHPEPEFKDSALDDSQRKAFHPKSLCHHLL